MSDLDLMLRFLLQAIVVLAACRAIGWFGQRFLAQSQVVMEMVTGVVLGPSLFGWLAPQAQSWLFPQKIDVVLNGVATTVKHPSMMILYCVAQLGLVLYMFLVGMEFDVRLVEKRMKGAISVSLAGILAPFLLGVGVTYLLLRDGPFFGPGVTPANAAVYVGAAMCITAFPMLARILYERGIARTSMGTLALGAGATDDAVAWCLLALVLAMTKGQPMVAVLAIGGGVLFAVLILTVGKRAFAHLAVQMEREGRMSPGLFVSTMLALMAGAYITDAIGIYAVFGAFLTGAAMPRGAFAEAVREKTEYLTVGLLLPFFFVYSGLNTKLSLVNTPALWVVAGAVLVAAVVGKGVACALAARAAGEPWREATTIGVLMNARGLMELIILNLGLQQGVITPTLFAIMVIMAVVTTLMASPLFQLVYGRRTQPAPAGGVPA